MSGFTDKTHLATYAYNDADRLAASGAIYQFLKVDSIDLGPFPFRAEAIVGVVSTFLDPGLRGVALDVGCGTGRYLPLLAAQFERVVLIGTTNGDGNMAESYELLARAASAVLGKTVAPLEPADARFTLETGSVALAESFDSVTMHHTRGVLVINDDRGLNILRAYYRSVDDEWTERYGIDWPALEAALDVVFVEEMKAKGEVRISTSSGVLVAR
jgi:SAM-dependent methyltransferase